MVAEWDVSKKNAYEWAAASTIGNRPFKGKQYK